MRGVNVYAKQRVDGRDRRQLERLCRYITRPVVAEQRLALRQDGRYEVTLKSPWRDGTRALLFEPLDLLTRLVAAIAPPRFHLLRYFGLLSSHSKLRAEVVPAPPQDTTSLRPSLTIGDQRPLAFVMDHAPPHAGRKRWAWLLWHVHSADVETCAKCGGPMRWAEVAEHPNATARLMRRYGFAVRTPPPPHRAPWRAPKGQLPLRLDA